MACACWLGHGKTSSRLKAAMSQFIGGESLLSAMREFAEEALQATAQLPSAISSPAEGTWNSPQKGARLLHTIPDIAGQSHLKCHTEHTALPSPSKVKIHKLDISLKCRGLQTKGLMSRPSRRQEFAKCRANTFSAACTEKKKNTSY